VHAALHDQHKGKITGPNGLAIVIYLWWLTLVSDLSLLFTFFVGHCYAPFRFMSTIIKTLIKNKSGHYTDAGNYRTIALSNVETKILESLLLNKITTCEDYDKYQFGFKKGHSTGLCTSVVKTAIDYNVSWGSHVFVLSTPRKHSIE